MNRNIYAQMHYVIGDATQPIKRPAVIIHSCNDQGAWGSGFVVALSQRWPGPEQAYHKGSKELGTITNATVEENLWVFNLVTQRGLGRIAQLNALSFEDCLARIAHALENWPFGERPTVHCPRIGADRGNTPWTYTEQALALGLVGHEVYVYDLTEEDFRKYKNRYGERYGSSR